MKSHRIILSLGIFGFQLLLPVTTHATGYTWSGTNGDWFNQFNWTNNSAGRRGVGFPAAGDDASIPSAVFHPGPTPNNASGEVQNLTVGECNPLQLDGTLTIKGVFDFKNAELRGGTLIIDAGATMNCSAFSPCQDGCSLQQNITVINKGTVNATLQGLSFYGATFNNQGTFNLGAKSLGYFTANSRFNNIGLFQTAEDNTSASLGTVFLRFDNTGTVKARTGTLRFLDVTSTGTFDAAVGGTNSFGGTVTNFAGSKFTGDGWAVNSANYFDVEGGILAETFDNLSGQLTGPGALSVSKNLVLRGGDLSAGLGMSSGCHTRIVSGFLFRGQILNGAAVGQGGVDWEAGDISGVEGALFSNNGPFVMHHNGAFRRWQFAAGGSPVFMNSSVFTKTNDLSNAPGSFTAPFNNNGVVEVDAGNLTLSGGGSNSFRFIVNDTLQFGGNYTCDTGSRVEGSGLGIVHVAGGATVNFNGNYDFNGLTKIQGSGATAVFNTANASSARVLLSDNLTVNGNFTARTNFDWWGGTVAGTGSVIVAESARLDLSTASHSIGRANPFTFVNRGQATWTSGDLTIAPNCALVNETGATFLANNSGILRVFGGAPGGGDFNNYGSFIQSNATGTVWFWNPVRLNNSSLPGSVQVRAGNLWLEGGASGGNFDVSAGANLSFKAYTYTLNPGATITGEGFATVAGTLNVPLGNASAQNLSLASGIIDGVGTLTIGQAMSWTSGTLNSNGAVNIASGATLSMYTGSEKTFMYGKTLNNYGHILWYDTGGIGLRSGTISNKVGATFEARGQSAMYSDPPAFHPVGAFVNEGLFVKTINTNETKVFYGVGFTNSATGTVRCESGWLSFWGGGLNDGGINQANANCTVSFLANLFVFNSGSRLIGDGFIRFQGPIRLAGATLAQNLAIESGASVDGAGDLEVMNYLSWSDGPVSGAAAINVDPGAIFSINGNSGKNLQRTINNRGTTTWSEGGNINASTGAQFNNLGTFEIRNHATYNGSAPSAILNQGVLLKVQDPLDTIIRVPVTNYPSGSILDRSGNLDFEPGGLWVRGGAVTLDGGGIKVGPPLDLNPGDLKGNGLFDGSVFNNGSGNPGKSPGLLTISGSYTQASAGALNIELAGLAAGTNYDQLRVGGTANLNGALNVSLLNGFMPNPGDTFEILTFGSRIGNFAAFSGLSLPNGLSLAPRFAANSLLLVTRSALILTNATLAGTNFTFSIQTTAGDTYRIEFTDQLAPANWQSLMTVLGDGTVKQIVLPVANGLHRFFRVGI